MTDRASLDSLSDDVIRHILQYGSSWTLFRFEATSQRYNGIVDEHFMSLKTVDLRMPKKGCSALVNKGMKNAVMTRFSHNLMEMKLSLSHMNEEWLMTMLPSVYPQLFPLSLKTGTRIKPLSSAAAISKLIKSLVIKTNVRNNTITLGWRKKLHITMHDLLKTTEYFNNQRCVESNSIRNDLNHVTKIVTYTIHDVEPAKFQEILGWYSNLKDIDIPMFDKVSKVKELNQIGGVLLTSKHNIRVSLKQKVSLPVLNLLCPYIDEIKGHLLKYGETVLKCPKLETIVIDDLSTINQNEIYNLMPHSIKELDIVINFALNQDSLVNFLTNQGCKLEMLRIKSHKRVENLENVKHVLSAISRNCNSLKKLCFRKTYGQFSGLVDEVLEHCSSKLEKLKLDPSCPVRSKTLALMAKACPRLKDLELSVNRTEDDAADICSCLCALQQLQVAQITIASYQDSVDKMAAVKVEDVSKILFCNHICHSSR
ncbi:hypothetical protein HDE_12733 [Halotydeus destructor]|nr:hypothetical protein HDE_12733 [Halotydeus destructor]